MRLRCCPFLVSLALLFILTAAKATQLNTGQKSNTMSLLNDKSLQPWNEPNVQHRRLIQADGHGGVATLEKRQSSSNNNNAIAHSPGNITSHTAHRKTGEHKLSKMRNKRSYPFGTWGWGPGGVPYNPKTVTVTNQPQISKPKEIKEPEESTFSKPKFPHHMNFLDFMFFRPGKRDHSQARRQRNKRFLKHDQIYFPNDTNYELLNVGSMLEPDEVDSILTGEFVPDIAYIIEKCSLSFFTSRVCHLAEEVMANKKRMMNSQGWGPGGLLAESSFPLDNPVGEYLPLGDADVYNTVLMEKGDDTGSPSKTYVGPFFSGGWGPAGKRNHSPMSFPTMNTIQSPGNIFQYLTDGHPYNNHHGNTMSEAELQGKPEMPISIVSSLKRSTTMPHDSIVERPLKKNFFRSGGWGAGGMPFSALYMNQRKPRPKPNVATPRPTKSASPKTPAKAKDNEYTTLNKLLSTPPKQQYYSIPHLFVSYGWGPLGR